jgi:4-hydroxy-3-methylbut-2-enyl diphosphate reductase
MPAADGSANRLCVLAPLRIEVAAARRAAVTADVRRTGMGPERSRRNAELIVATLGHDQPVAIVGVCGALTPDLHPGDVVVASTVSSQNGEVWLDLPGADLIASDLVSRGIPTHVGPILSTDHVVTREARPHLAARGWLAVDMESAWLAEAAGSPGGARPIAVVRVVLDTPDHELRSVQTLRHVKVAQRRLAAVVSALEAWARITGPRTILLAGPRSFCAGVERAIDIVERAIDRFPAPIYVRRQIVHNSHVVADLERKGAVFVQEVDEVPAGATLVLAAHGVTPEVRRRADERSLRVIDATCPLVGKVHAEARRFAAQDFDIVLIGHGNHEEVEGTIGEAPDRITVVGSTDDVAALEVKDPERVAYLTQTTLATDEVAGIVTELKERFPTLVGPAREDICYATQNRQDAVVAIAPDADVVLVVGSPNSSNSVRLTEVATRAGCRSYLVDGCADIRLSWLDGATTIGVTAGASAPESKVREVVAAIGSLGPITVEERVVHDENVSFPLPSQLRTRGDRR